MGNSEVFNNLPSAGPGESGGWGSSSGVILENGTLRNMYWKLPAAPGTAGSGKSRTFTVWRNHLPTDLTVTIADTDTEGSITGVDLTVWKGDYVYLSATAANSPATINSVSGYPTYSIEFEANTPGLSVYGSARHSFLTSDSTPQGTEIFQGLFFGPSQSWANPAGLRRNMVSADGTVVEYAVEYQTETQRVFEFYLYKNDIKQDGTGGTVDTKITMTGTSRMERESARRTVNLPVVVGDYVYVSCTQTSADTGTPLRMHVAATFLADDPGVFLLCGFSAVNSTSTDGYCAVTKDGSLGFAATEAGEEITIGPVTDPLEVVTIAMSVGTAPGSGNSRTLTVRKNGATPSDAPSAVVSDSDMVAIDGGTLVSYAEGDRISIFHHPFSTPAATGTVTWGVSGFLYPGGTTLFSPFLAGI
jgi:hypothetical protein